MLPVINAEITPQARWYMEELDDRTAGSTDGDDIITRSPPHVEHQSSYNCWSLKSTQLLNKSLLKCPTPTIVEIQYTIEPQLCDVVDCIVFIKTLLSRMMYMREMQTVIYGYPNKAVNIYVHVLVICVIKCIACVVTNLESD